MGRWNWTMVGLSMALVAVHAGCAGGGGRANVSPRAMPDGGSYTGVWHSPQYGEMHLVQTGSQVVGCYTKDERRGRIQGTVQGDLMRFEWSERREMVAGRPTTTRGRGYFQYAIGDDTDHYAQGEWGHDNSETGGGPWRAVRDRRRTRRPDPDTCGLGAATGDAPQGDSFEDSGSGGASDDLGDL